MSRETTLIGFDSLKWIAVCNNPNVEQRKVFFAGGSGGGYLAACAALPLNVQRHGLEPCGLILFNPVLDMTPLKKMHEEYEGDLERFSPFQAITQDYPPGIIFHGKSDTRVPFSESEKVANRLNAIGGRCRLVGFEGKDHGFFNYGLHGNSPYESTIEDTVPFIEGLVNETA